MRRLFNYSSFVILIIIFILPLKVGSKKNDMDDVKLLPSAEIHIRCIANLLLGKLSHLEIQP